MAGEQIEKAAEAERRHEPLEPEHAPNVDYLRQKDYLMMYPRYEKTYMESIAPKHQPPEKVRSFEKHCLLMKTYPFMQGFTAEGKFA